MGNFVMMTPFMTTGYCVVLTHALLIRPSGPAVSSSTRVMPELNAAIVDNRCQESRKTLAIESISRYLSSF